MFTHSLLKAREVMSVLEPPPDVDLEPHKMDKALVRDCDSLSTIPKNVSTTDVEHNNALTNEFFAALHSFMLSTVDFDVMGQKGMTIAFTRLFSQLLISQIFVIEQRGEFKYAELGKLPSYVQQIRLTKELKDYTEKTSLHDIWKNIVGNTKRSRQDVYNIEREPMNWQVLNRSKIYMPDPTDNMDHSGIVEESKSRLEKLVERILMIIDYQTYVKHTMSPEKNDSHPKFYEFDGYEHCLSVHGDCLMNIKVAYCITCSSGGFEEVVVRTREALTKQKRGTIKSEISIL